MEHWLKSAVFGFAVVLIVGMVIFLLSVTGAGENNNWIGPGSS